MGFEPTTFCMASKRSTPELFPLKPFRFSHSHSFGMLQETRTLFSFSRSSAIITPKLSPLRARETSASPYFPAQIFKVSGFSLSHFTVLGKLRLNNVVSTGDIYTRFTPNSNPLYLKFTKKLSLCY